jgi:hypothetical protein
MIAGDARRLCGAVTDAGAQNSAAIGSPSLSGIVRPSVDV